MHRLIYILVLWLVVESAFGQSVKIESDRAAYDTVCSIHDRMLELEPLHRDSSLHQKLSRLIGPAKKWAREQGTETERAQCALIHWRHLNWTRSPDTYSRIIIAREIWNYRNEIDRSDLIPVLGHLSSFYQRTKRPEDRLKVMQEICVLKSQVDSVYHCGELAGVYHDLRQYDRAIEQYHVNVYHDRMAGRWFRVSSLYNNIGLAHRDLGRRDSATHYFRAALNLLSDKELMTEVKPFYLKHFTTVVRWNLEHLLESGLTQEKIQLANSLVWSGNKVPEYVWVLEGYKLLTHNYYEKRKFETARSYVDSALQLATRTKHMDVLVELLKFKGKILLAQDKFEESDQLFDRSKFIADSMRLAEAALDASIAAAQFEAKERERELRSSQERAKLAEIKVQSEQRQRQWLTALFAGSVVILVLVVVLLRVSAKNRKTITAQKQQLEKSLSEREVLLKEIHHRVKNNLQVISSLLDLQSNRMADQASQTAFLEGQSRVKSIALIHQQLYQNEELTGVEFVAFTEALFKQVRSAMMERGQKVELLLKAKPTSFDIDTAVPLGLILNEMLTNSFKHAISVSKASTIAVELLNPEEGRYQLKYTDGGPGLSEEIDLKKVRSLGLRLIYRLTRQLGGTVKTNANDGNLFIIEFLDTEARKEHN